MSLKVLNLACSNGHLFEGWFRSDTDWLDQQSRGLLQCPICGDKSIEKRPAAPYVKTETTVREAKRQWMARLREVASKAEDVGVEFAQEARAMARGDAPKRMIRGSCTVDEARALIKDGVSVLPIPESTGKTLN